MINLTICADDFGLAPGINTAVLELVDRKRLTATSCMTQTEYWRSDGAALAAYHHDIDIGVHFTLTDQRPCGPMPRLAPDGRLPPLGLLARLAFLRQLDPEEIKTELRRQVDSFESVLGFEPNHIDGHHHVHQLPVIRDVVIDWLARKGGRSKGYLRSTLERTAVIVRRKTAVTKSLVLAAGSVAMTHSAAVSGIAHNSGFGGFYNVGHNQIYREAFARFLIGIRENSLIMCHPGKVDAILTQSDSLTQPRQKELAFFLSDDYPMLLASAGARLSRLGQSG